MKIAVPFFAILIFLSSLSFAQERMIARGATPGELYLTGLWYGIYSAWGFPVYDTLRMAVYHITENGKKLTVQYDADWFDFSGSVVNSRTILADAAPGVVYNVQYYENNDACWWTQLWVSFNYGKNWIFREEAIGSKIYVSTNAQGVIYRGDGLQGMFKSTNYGQDFFILENVAKLGKEAGLMECEFFSLEGPEFYHTNNCFQSETNIILDEEYVHGLTAEDPDVYRGGLPGEVYISSLFPDPNYYRTYKVSFSADTGYTFRHVFVSESYPPTGTITPCFMSDREPGVFYILRRYTVEDFSPHGEHLKLCIEYYRDYGETLEATFCHDITKNYEYEEVVCDNVTSLTSKIENQNSVQLQWSSSAENSSIRGYHIYRNNIKITSELLTDTIYLDENLPIGDYYYFIKTYFKEGCVSDTSNHVEKTIEIVTCEPVNNLVSEKCNNNCVLLTWSKPESSLPIEGYSIFRNEQLLTGDLITNPTYFDENLSVGEYEYYVITHYTNGCVSDSSNHVAETIALGVKELKELGGVILYPNPTTGELTINNEQLTINNIEIYDVYGKELSSNHLISKSSNHQINISHLPAGIYFVRATTEQGIITKKVVKY